MDNNVNDKITLARIVDWNEAELILDNLTSKLFPNIICVQTYCNYHLLHARVNRKQLPAFDTILALPSCVGYSFRYIPRAPYTPLQLEI